MIKLNKNNLALLPDTIKRPKFDLSKRDIGIVHIGGTSNFFKAFIAPIVHNLMDMNESMNYGILAVSLRSHQPVEDFRVQDFLYTLVEKGESSNQATVIGSICDGIYAPSNYDYVLDHLGSSKTKLVTLTITQKGYCQDSLTGKLALDDPDLIHDFQHINTPRTAIGLIVSGLIRRREHNHGPIVIISCDNLPGNGFILRDMLLEFANIIDGTEFGLKNWINDNVFCPITAVDRIVPKLTEDFRSEVEGIIEMQDCNPVLTEPFWEFVIQSSSEPKFNLFPPLDKVGAKFTVDPNAFWERKFNLLNAGHTFIATLAQRLPLLEYIHEAMRVEIFRVFLRNIMDGEITPTLSIHAQDGIDAYKSQLISRFTNDQLKDRVERVGAEGSRKVPKYVISNIQKCIQTELPIEGLCIVLSAWICSLSSYNESRQPINLLDPNAVKYSQMSGQLILIVKTHEEQSAVVQCFIPILMLNVNLFSATLVESHRFLNQFTTVMGSVTKKGILNTVNDYNEQRSCAASELLRRSASITPYFSRQRSSSAAQIEATIPGQAAADKGQSSQLKM